MIQLYVTDKDGSIKVEYLKKNTTYTIQEVETTKGTISMRKYMSFQ